MTKKSLLLFLCIAATGCLEEDYPDEFISEESADQQSSVTTKLQYEGSCEFLKNCSKWSSNGISWGCSNVDNSCGIDQNFVAIPKTLKGKICGDWVEICKGDRCTWAEVKDVSCCGKWETWRLRK